MKTARACERCFYLLTDANLKKGEDVSAHVQTHTQTVSQRQTALSRLLELWILVFLAQRSGHQPDYSAPALVPSVGQAAVW